MKVLLLLPILQLALQCVLAQELKCSVAYVQLGDSAYKLERGKFDWWDAARSCMDLGGQLATIDSEQELNAVSQYLNQLGFGSDEAVWFSGFGIKSGAWISLANSRIQTYFKWATAEPNDSYSAESCLGIKVSSGNWLMHDLSCFKEYSYLCAVVQEESQSDRNRSVVEFTYNSSLRSFVMRCCPCHTDCPMRTPMLIYVCNNFVA